MLIIYTLATQYSVKPISMKKSVYIFVILLATGLYNLSYGQQKLSLGYFQSFPIGAYGSTDLQSGSYAEPGWGVVLENRASMPGFPDGLYLGFHYSYQYNSFNSEEFAKDLASIAENDIYIAISEASYNPSVITFGPYYEFVPFNGFSVELKAGAGILFTNIDPLVIDIYNDRDMLLRSEVLRFSSQPTFTYLAGLGIGFDISRSFRLGIFAEHSSSKEKIKTTFDNVEGIGSEFRISYLNAGISLALLFD